MVSDIIAWSHPGKKLEKHTFGVLEKSKKHCILPINAIAILFHDTGKLNPNFQRIVQGLPSLGYSHHAYLSVLFFYSFLKQNEKEIYKRLCPNGSEDFRIKILQIIALIAHHHGDLPNFSDLLNSDELNDAFLFLQKSFIDAGKFITNNLQLGGNAFTTDIKTDKEFDHICKYSLKRHQPIWDRKVLDYFSDTQFAFAALLEADKRDAGNNDFYLFAEKTAEINEQISKSLSAKFGELDAVKNPSQLNKLRTEIRLEATEGIASGIRQGQRIFTLTAPTGAGKTFTLLAVAKEIQKYDKNLGIIYSLPFLSITEQVQEVLRNLGIDYLAVNSRAQNNQIEEAQKKYEQTPSKENLDELIRQSFSEETFDHPFIVTTFVQFFETLISNKNATLLKLPNFCNRIFLIDEVQALPPRLYIFFSAWLQDFCKRHNSYAVLSTATMPKLDFPQKDFLEIYKKPELLFPNYSAELPVEIIQPHRYFESSVFNRYKINLITEEFKISDLAAHILSQTESCLVILNTISDTKNLYQSIFKKTTAILLNTHFTAADRLKKIEEVKNYLKIRQKVVLISTQLIEAGVDIDFPVVYRDLCPLPSIIQSAGRCNRNKSVEFGQVFFFQLTNEQGKQSSELIYKKEASRFLDFCKKHIQHGIEERDLFNIQSRFFEEIKSDLTIGEFEYADFGAVKKANLIECINKAEFETVGKLQLINEKIFGEQYQYYIPKNEADMSYDELVELMLQSMQQKDYANKKAYKIKMQNKLKEMETRILTVRLKKNETAPAFRNSDEYFDIRVLSDLNSYSYQTGLDLGIENLLL